MRLYSSSLVSPPHHSLVILSRISDSYVLVILGNIQYSQDAVWISKLFFFKKNFEKHCVGRAAT